MMKITWSGLRIFLAFENGLVNLNIFGTEMVLYVEYMENRWHSCVVYKGKSSGPITEA